MVCVVANGDRDGFFRDRKVVDTRAFCARYDPRKVVRTQDGIVDILPQIDKGSA